MKTITFNLNGVEYAKNERTMRCSACTNGKKVRISLNKFNEAYQEYLDEEDDAIRSVIDRIIIEENNNEFNEIKARASKKTRVGGMEFNESGVSVFLTEKQVSFIKELPNSNFWENGLDSSLWVDVLCDELSDQMGPMTVGAMVSTLREKGLLLVGKDKRNHKERRAAFFELSELGKKVVAKVLGL